jgi:hypothetical protein
VVLLCRHIVRMWPNRARGRGEGADSGAGQLLIMELYPCPHYMSNILDSLPSNLKMSAACSS